MQPKVLSLGGALAEAMRLCPGVSDALLVDSDGVLIEAARTAASSIDAEELAAEGLAAAHSVSRVAASAGIGTFDEWTLSSDGGLLVVRRVPPIQAVVILRLPEQVFLGRARFAARVVAGRLGTLLAG